MDHKNNPICAKIGHVYTLTLSIRCPHDESVVTTTRVWQDTGNDETIRYVDEELHHGPFDATEDIGRAAGGQHAAGVAAARTVH